MTPTPRPTRDECCRRAALALREVAQRQATKAAQSAA